MRCVCRVDFVVSCSSSSYSTIFSVPPQREESIDYGPSIDCEPLGCCNDVDTLMTIDVFQVIEFDYEPFSTSDGIERLLP